MNFASFFLFSITQYVTGFIIKSGIFAANMSGWLKYIWLSVLFHIVWTTCLFSQDKSYGRISVMFYNVENLFDIYDDSLKDDNDFLPGGVMRWNYSRYIKKIHSLYKVIASAGEWNIPEIIAMCEIENREVVQDLLYKTSLSKYDYGIVHEDSPDRRGIDVCMIYRKDAVKLLNYRYLIPSGTGVENFHSRSVLYAKLRVYSDTLHLLVNHWPSRRGGRLAGEEMRKSIAMMVGEVCDSVAGVNNEKCKIVICGDFNSTPDDTEIQTMLYSAGSGTLLENISLNSAKRGEGSYRYKGTWEMIDQIIVSKTLLNDESGLCTSMDHFRIFKPDFLLENDLVYPGLSPFSTYKGYRYHGGYSDHLPVLADLFMKVPCQGE